MNANLEVRQSNLELRADERTLGGYAAVFYNGNPNTEYQLWDNVKERVGRDAFRSLIQGNSDVIVSYNHDMVTLLGRRSAGTLQLSVDDVGLRWDVPFDKDDPDHVRIARKIQKREITGCSFAFTTTKDSWSHEGNSEIRMLEDVNVVELGPVVQCAYTGTSVGLRTLQDAREAKESYDMFLTNQLLDYADSLKK